VFKHAKSGCLDLNIKLANDGFLYKHESSFSTTATGITNSLFLSLLAFNCFYYSIIFIIIIGQTTHKFSDWALLDKKYEYAFAPLLKFARAWLGLERVKYQIRYNFVHRRIDFKAYDDANKRQLTITFEPGHPESMDTEDYWVEDSL
jgi:hypothetical protein